MSLDPRSLLNKIERLEDEIRQLRRDTAKIPARWGGNGRELTFPTGVRYSIIQIIDDYNTVGADDARFKIPTTP